MDVRQSTLETCAALKEKIAIVKHVSIQQNVSNVNMVIIRPDVILNVLSIALTKIALWKMVTVCNV